MPEFQTHRSIEIDSKYKWPTETTLSTWTTFPFDGEFEFDADRVRKNWPRLHSGDLEPLPREPEILRAWAHFHNGEFHKACEIGRNFGIAGFNVANKSACVYANYLEKHEARRLALFLEVSERADQQIQQDADNINAYYWRAYARGRYSQGISVVKALAQGLGSKIKSDLEKVLGVQPNHPGAHFTLGFFHAEVIDKVGLLIGSMTYGANKDKGLHLFAQALKLNTASSLGLIEYAQALLMLEGESRIDEANRLYKMAASAKPVDAMERLDVELAKALLKN
jgi:tetratricopeptide (TPR) repeat protein